VSSAEFGSGNAGSQPDDIAARQLAAVMVQRHIAFQADAPGPADQRGRAIKPVGGQKDRHALWNKGPNRIKKFLLHRKADVALGRAHPLGNGNRPLAKPHRQYQHLVLIIDSKRLA
jgi:hypothetical protein